MLLYAAKTLQVDQLRKELEEERKDTFVLREQVRL